MGAQSLQSRITNADTASLELEWILPEGWEEAAASGVRMATFLPPQTPADLAECSLVAFPGEVGGLDANLIRWAGQIGVEPDTDQLQAIKDEASPLQLEGQVLPIMLYDLSMITRDGDQNILAAVAAKDGYSIFLKFMGEPSVLNQHREGFLELAASLR